MTNLVMFGLPVVIGGLAGASGRRSGAGLFAHTGRALVAFLVTVVVLYASGCLLGVTAVGGRNSLSTLLPSMAFLFSRYGVVYWLVSVVTTLPLTVLGYVGGVLVAAPAARDEAKRANE